MIRRQILTLIGIFSRSLGNSFQVLGQMLPEKVVNFTSRNANAYNQVLVRIDRWATKSTPLDAAREAAEEVPPVQNP